MGLDKPGDRTIVQFSLVVACKKGLDYLINLEIDLKAGC